MRVAIFNNRLDGVEREFEFCGSDGHPLAFSIKTAPEQRRPEPIFVIVNFTIADSEVGEHYATPAQPSCNGAEYCLMLRARDMKKRV